MKLRSIIGGLALMLTTSMAAHAADPVKFALCYDLSKAYTFVTPQVAQAAKDYAELLLLLNRGVVDAVIGPESVLRSMDARDGGEALRVTTLDSGYDFYTAAGPGMSEAVAQRVRAAYQQLVDGGMVR